MLQHFRMFAAYNRWANSELYAAAADLTVEELNRDDRIWLRRFTGTGEAPATLDATISGDLVELTRLRTAEDERIVAYVDSLTKEALQDTFTYQTITDRKTISQRLSPALAHLFNHQTHHRGQIHATLTALGKPSVVLDLIFFHRTGDGKKFA